MKTALEDRLSDALAQRAASVPRVASERVCSVDYQPRRQRLAVPVAVGAGAAASAATVGTVLAVVLGGAAPAYAGWSPAPSASTAAPPSPQASQSCLTSLPSNEPAGGQLGSGSWQSVLTDVRGPFTVALFQNDGAYAACFTSPSFTEVTQVSAADGSASNAQTQNGTVRGLGSGGLPGGSIVAVGGTTSGDLQNVVQTHLSTTADGPYTLVDGRVATGVTAVTLVRDDGQDVVATVEDGWLIAWWPGGATATSAQVTNASGTSTEELQSADKGGPGPATPPQPGACASAAGTANASKSSDGQPTNVPVHCSTSGSSTSGTSGPGLSTNTGISGSGLKSGG
ncbi:MAG TPA: hypothetical protein VNU75_12005 [Acidimicrobiales bacterium]|jgi:hypothetical protein|nr:hypothetical protein [Acidimicrobiales bacterium]